MRNDDSAAVGLAGSIVVAAGCLGIFGSVLFYGGIIAMIAYAVVWVSKNMAF